jgi:RNA-directed DNA polymerase
MSVTNNAHQRTQELRQKLHAAAQASPNRRFHALYDKLFSGYILETAWQQVAENGGAAGVDGVTIASIREQGVGEFLKGIATELREGTYRAQPVLRVFIPKSDGGQRPLGIPTVRDRVVQAAAKLVLEPIFEADFTEDSYGFRPGRGQVDALRVIERQMWSSWFVVEADIEAYFDSVNHSKLHRLLRLRISDRRMLALIDQWLKCGYVDATGHHRTPKGTPQGGVLSPLLANIYLNYLDRQWQKRHQIHGTLVRYADDFVLLCRTRLGARKALEAVQEITRKLGLQLHPGKTRIVELVNGTDGFDFLGMHLRLVRQCKNPKQFRPTSWPSAQAMRVVQARVRQMVRATRRTDEAYSLLLEDLRKYLGGWANYFKHSRECHRKFSTLEHCVRGQLLAWHLRRLGGRRPQAATRRVLTHLRELPRMVRPNDWQSDKAMPALC